jgi:hypothetical protein
MKQLRRRRAGSRPHTSSLIAATVALVSFAVSARDALAQCQYEIAAIVPGEQVCSFDGYQELILRAINNHDVAVGTRALCIGGPVRMVRWTMDGGLEDLDPPIDCRDVYPRDINDDGTIVGTISFDDPDYSLGFVLEDGEWTFLTSSPEGMRCSPLSINSSGEVVGSRKIVDSDGLAVEVAFRWTRTDGYTDLPSPKFDRSGLGHISDDGTAVGWDRSLGANAGPLVWNRDPVFPAPAVESHQFTYRDRSELGETTAIRWPRDVLPPDYESWLQTVDGDWIRVPSPWNDRRLTLFHINDLGQAFGRAVPPGNQQFAIAPIRIAGIVHNLNELVIPTRADPFSGMSFDFASGDDVGQVYAVNDHGVIATEATRWIDNPGSTLRHGVGIVLRPIGMDPRDLDGDCDLDVDDLRRLIASWGRQSVPADLDADGTVDFDDLLSLLTALR